MFFTIGLALIPFVSAAVHDVQVGANGLSFDPPAISAAPNDQVVFHFHAKNHSVVQSSLDNPCGPKDGGVNTGFFPVPVNQTDNFPTYTVRINDTTPFWAYCSQGARTAASHCGAGMVFSVNCGPDGAPNSFDSFKNSALEIGKQLSASAAASSTEAGATPSSEGGSTAAPDPTPTLMTQTITVESSTWTTTYSSFPNSPAATPASLEGNIIFVDVGKDGLAFNPSRVDALVRDTIVFRFHAKNHTVTQSSFADPCKKLTAADGTAGFDSGFMPVADTLTDNFPEWNYTVTDTAPVWAYCAQLAPKSHCSAGMVFAVNSDEKGAKSFSAFQQQAEGANGTSTSPSASADGSSPTGAATVNKLSQVSLTLVLTGLVAALL
jgi:plastocyanin